MNKNIPLYQKLASKIKKLKILGLTHNQIGCMLKISLKTVKKSVKFTEEISKFKSNY